MRAESCSVWTNSNHNKMSEAICGDPWKMCVVYQYSLDKLRRLFETNIELANLGADHLHSRRVPAFAWLALGTFGYYRQKNGMRSSGSEYPQAERASSTWVYRLVFGYNTLDAQSSQGSPKMTFAGFFDIGTNFKTRPPNPQHGTPTH